MTAFKTTLAALAFATIAATPSFARDIAINQEGQMVVFSGTGQAKIGTMKSFDTFKNGARQLPGGVVIMMHQGKLYLYEDPKNAMYDHATDIGQF